MLDSCKVMHHVGVTTMQQVDMMRMHKTKPILHMRVLNARLRRIDNSDLHPAPQLIDWLLQPVSGACELGLTMWRRQAAQCPPLHALTAHLVLGGCGPRCSNPRRRRQQ
mmetsp:Transcript_49154/g.110536  ORF Transcript_49154/g.110536 Transcript_49154/m.110536 type:complete len:109 (+) Transcript_49154:157-483(+)